MGCCSCRSQSAVVNDPDIFRTEARLIFASRHTLGVLLYIKKNKLYQASPCCGILCCNNSQRLSSVEVVTGTVNILHHSGTHTVKVHHVNLGLRVNVSRWYGPVVKIYDTPDAVELARRLNPDTVGSYDFVPTRINMTLLDSAPRGGRGL